MHWLMSSPHSDSLFSASTAMSALHSPKHLHHCSSHEAQDDVYPPKSSPEQPSQTFHPSLIPLPAGILGSAAGGSHYSGAKVYHRKSDVERASSGARDHHVELTEKRRQVLEDLKDVSNDEILQFMHLSAETSRRDIFFSLS